MATSDEQRAPRFSIDHGIIHDRMSRKYLRTVLGESPAFDAEVHETLAELNQLDEDVANVAVRLIELMRDQVFQQAPQARADEQAAWIVEKIDAELGAGWALKLAEQLHGVSYGPPALAANTQQSNGAVEKPTKEPDAAIGASQVPEGVANAERSAMQLCPSTNPQQIASETKENEA